MTAEWDAIHQAFGWGDLMHHDVECDECEGNGVDDDGDQCAACTDGQTRWGSFYGDADGQCDQCGRDTHINCRLYENESVCLRCYVRAHAHDCGCDLWMAAEKALGTVRAAAGELEGVT